MITIVTMDPVEVGMGLCATCRYQRTVGGARSTFSLCERSFTDARFRKYPPLPVVRCSGYAERPATSTAPPDNESSEKNGKL